jgi:hypothetical protein
MSPAIRNGDVPTIAPIAGTPCGIGEIVAFAVPGQNRVVVHRIVAAAGGGG